MYNTCTCVCMMTVHVSSLCRVSAHVLGNHDNTCVEWYHPIATQHNTCVQVAHHNRQLDNTYLDNAQNHKRGGEGESEKI